MSDTHAPDAPNGRSYTLREAATILGRSVSVVRRQVASGQIRAERVQRPQGSVWRVFLDGDTLEGARSVTVAEGHQSHAPAEPQAERAPDPVASELIALVGELSQKLAESAAVASMWQERARVLGERLALAAPQTPQAGATDTVAQVVPRWPFLPLWRPVAYSVMAVVAIILLLVWPR